VSKSVCCVQGDVYMQIVITPSSQCPMKPMKCVNKITASTLNRDKDLIKSLDYISVPSCVI